MSVRKQRQVASDAGLSKQRVVVEAVRLADREGVDGLSMRRLAGALGAGAMSLYYYVASKEELLDAMIDVVFEEIELPPEETDWQSAMRRRAVSARQVLARHPWAIGLMESRTSPGPANLRHHEAVTACLRRAGFSVLMATHANWLLDSYVYGSPCRKPACRSTPPMSSRTWSRTSSCPSFLLTSSPTSTSRPRRSLLPATTRRRRSSSASTSS